MNDINCQKIEGEWIHEEPEIYIKRTYCSICKAPAPFIYVCHDPYGKDMHGETKKTKFCPNCGARMKNGV